MIKFLFITFLVILFLRMVAPFLFRWLITFLIGRQVRKGVFSTFQQGAPQPQQSRPTNRKGSINIDFVPPPEKPKKSFDGGEYVEYEEVK